MSRGPTKTGWVSESMKPGRTTLPEQSSSSAFLATVRNSSVVPTGATVPFSIRTAPSATMPRSHICEPRRGAGSPRRVRSCEAWVRMVAGGFIVAGSLSPYTFAPEGSNPEARFARVYPLPVPFVFSTTSVGFSV